MGPGFESLKVHQWPIGQVVKTAASHAVNIGSNPVWVTKILFDCLLTEKIVGDIISLLDSSAVRSHLAFDYKRWVKTHPYELVLIVMRVHLFPFRTQKLSSCTPTILGG